MNPYNNNMFMYPYQPQTNMYQNNLPRVEVVKVNGRNGAEAYNLAPNSSILLLDEHDSIVWLKTTDGAGYPTVTPYSITPYQPEPPIDVKQLNDRLSRLENIINEQSYIKQNDVQSSKSSNTTVIPNNQNGSKPSRGTK